MKEREEEEFGLDGVDDSSLSLEIQHAIGSGESASIVIEEG